MSDADDGAPVVMIVEVRANRDGSMVPEIITELGPEVVEAILRQTADVVSGKNDRAAGAWGRT
jgi:hypothetical protein